MEMTLIQYYPSIILLTGNCIHIAIIIRTLYSSDTLQQSEENASTAAEIPATCSSFVVPSKSKDLLAVLGHPASNLDFAQTTNVPMYNSRKDDPALILRDVGS